MGDRVTRKRVDRSKYANVSVGGAPGDGPDHDGLLRCETPRATYHLHPGNHSRATDLPADTVGGLDALVVEDAFHEYASVSLDDFYRHTQWRGLLETVFTTGRQSVFLLDLPASAASVEEWATRSRRRLLALLATTLVLAPLAWLLHPLAGVVATPLALPSALLLAESCAGRLSAERLRDRPSRLRGLVMLAWWWTVYGGRSALIADKLERFVAPKLGHDLERRPSLLIDYGSLHLDTYYYLRYPRLRRSVLTYHEWRGWGNKDGTYADRVCEFVLTDVAPTFRNEMDERDRSYKHLVYEFRDGRGR